MLKLKRFFQDVGRLFGPPSFNKIPDQLPGVPVTAASPTRPISNIHVPLYAANNINDLTQFPNWDWARFRSVLVSLALTGSGIYIPFHRRPDSVFLDGLQPVLNELQDLSHRHKGRALSRGLIIDRSGKGLVSSGKTSIGAQINTTITLTLEPESGHVQEPILTIHILPEAEPVYGSSNVDYASFLTDLHQIAMVISWKFGVILLLKTTATLYALQPEMVQKLVTSLRSEYLERTQPRDDPQFSLFCFNKAVCSRFGLTYYEASHDSLLARQVTVND
jgi:hypothetical protein